MKLVNTLTLLHRSSVILINENELKIILSAKIKKINIRGLDNNWELEDGKIGLAGGDLG